MYTGGGYLERRKKEADGRMRGSLSTFTFSTGLCVVDTQPGFD
jgi:hypothetical protein